MLFHPFPRLVANRLVQLGREFPRFFPSYSTAQMNQLHELLSQYLDNRVRTPTQRWSMNDWPPQEEVPGERVVQKLKWPEFPKYPMPEMVLDEVAIILAIVEKVTGFRVETSHGVRFLAIPMEQNGAVLYNPFVDKRKVYLPKMDIEARRTQAVRTIDFLQD